MDQNSPKQVKEARIDMRNELGNEIKVDYENDITLKSESNLIKN